MTENITDKLIQKISATCTDEDILRQLHTVLDELKTIYSYIVYERYEQDKLAYWQLEYTISQKDRYNTLQADDVVNDIFKVIKESGEQKIANVIGYKQPPIEMQLQLFEPFISKCALKQVQRWSQLELDDAKQMCRLTMLNLYHKGYYLHPSLIERCYNNDILCYLRSERNKPEIVSIDTVVHQGEDNSLTLADMLPDISIEEEEEAKQDEDFIKDVFGQVKDICIELIGERQFEQLMRDYGNKHTTSWSQRKMYRLKEKFKEMGLSWSSFYQTK